MKLLFSNFFVCALLVAFCACKPPAEIDVVSNAEKFGAESDKIKALVLKVLINDTNKTRGLWPKFSQSIPGSRAEVGTSLYNESGVWRAIATQQAVLYDRYLISLKVDIFIKNGNSDASIDEPVLYIAELGSVRTSSDGRTTIKFTDNAATLNAKEAEQWLTNALQSSFIEFELKTNAPVKGAHAALF